MYFKLNNKVLPKAVSKLTHLELLKSMFTTRAVVRVMMVVIGACGSHVLDSMCPVPSTGPCCVHVLLVNGHGVFLLSVKTQTRGDMLTHDLESCTSKSVGREPHSYAVKQT